MSSSGIYLNEEEAANVVDTGKYIDSSVSRKQVLDAVTTVSIADKYFKDYNVEVDTTSLCCVDGLTQTHCITDIYVNGFYINIIKVDLNAELLVPCLHFNKRISPVAYMFISEQADKQSYEVLGFVLKDDIDTNNLLDGYYSVGAGLLKNFSDIEYLFTGHVEEEIPDNFEKQVFDYFDGINVNNEDLIYILLNSKVARTFFIKAFRAKKVFCYVSVPENNLTEEKTENGMDVVDEIGINQASESLLIDSNDEHGVKFDVENPGLDSFDVNDIVISEANEDNTDNYDLYSVADMADNNQQVVERNESVGEYEEMEVQRQAEDETEYATGITPSLETLEQELSDDNQEIDPDETNQNEDSINSLYTNEDNNVVGAQFVQPQNKSGFLPALLIISLIAGCGYFGYTRFYKQNEVPAYTEESQYEEQAKSAETNNTEQADAMPVETVENIEEPKLSEEPSGPSIPAIEKNLDASIFVENLSVNWQVPSGYVANSMAKRYFTKIGKIIQLNLKTEMLLLNKPPLSDKIEIELEFNKNSQNFKVKEVKTSSGEQTIDDLVKNVVEKTLNNAKNTDMSIFNNIPGSPILIVHL